MTESVLIILPLPARVLSPNWHVGSRGYMMKKAAAAKRYRKLARIEAEASEISSGPWPLAEVAAAFYFRQQRRRDQDNYMAMLKPAYDGLVDAGLLEDDDYEHLKRLPPVFLLDRENPRVELELRRLANGE